MKPKVIAIMLALLTTGLASSCKHSSSQSQPSNKELMQAIQQFQEDADVIRLEHILYWSELFEEYHSKKGVYPLQDRLKKDEMAILVKIATHMQRSFISPGTENYNSAVDMNAGKRFREFSIKDLVSEIEHGLERKIEEKYDIQKAPTRSPIGYYYFATQDGFLIWCICPTYGVSHISTLLMDGFTPTVNIVSEGMKGKVTKALTREELINHPIFKKWTKRKLSKEKAVYVRQLIAEHHDDSKQTEKEE